MIAIALLMAPAIFARQNGALKLGKIEIEGLQDYKPDQIVAASGLQLGQAISIEAIEPAAKQLMKTGLFKSLTYNYRTTGNQLEIIFKVEEAKARVLCVFDNFIWFSDEEILTAIRRELPFFNGFAPETGNMTDTITRALDRLLQERRIPGRAHYILSTGDLNKPKLEHIFSVRGPNLQLCAIRFAGVSGVPEAQLLKQSEALLNLEYSRQHTTLFAQNTLTAFYRQRGYLRAKFLAPQAQPVGDSGGKCKDGIAVTLTVEEGPAYTWDKAAWAGNQALPQQTLDGLLGMKAGAVADGVKLEAGLTVIRKAYNRQGYFEAKLTASPEMDDANRRVSYRIAVNEGPQYHMGKLEIIGLPENDSKRMLSKWQLRAGAVFDTSYFEEFTKKAMEGFNPRAGSLPRGVKTNAKPNRQTQTVDVTIQFEW